MTCDCPDTVVFGHHCWERDTIRVYLRPGEWVIPVSEVMRRYTAAMKTLTTTLDMHRPPS